MPEEVRERFLELLAEGVPARQICRTPGFPCNATFYHWRKTDPEFDRRVQVMAQFGRDVLIDTVSEEFERILEEYPPKVARKWWNLRHRDLVKVNPRFFGGGPDRK